MKSPLRFALGGGSLFLLAFLGTAPAQNIDDDDDRVPDGVEILTRGPVHEAFAQPNDIKPGSGQAIAQQPPGPVPEEPPEERPEGDNIQFIPGYWAWDAEQSKFLWVSGGYRNAPVGRQWVPGYWVHTDEGWRWVSGMWANEQQDELRFTPEPPAPLEVEPTLPPTSEDSTWIPGNWVYRDTSFAWRPGYWTPYRAGRVWVTPRYTWTPTGYLYNDGYWDCPLEDRGLLFAPVYFHRPFWHTAGWFWRPSYVVSFGLIYDSCFTNYGFSHFYFGNYYGPRCYGLGYYPWFHGYGRYNSTFAYHRWHDHHHDHDWYGRQRDLYRDRHDGRVAGPPRTFADQRALVRNKTVVNNTNINQVRAVAPLNQVKNVNKNVNLVKLTAAQTATQKAAIARTQQIAQARAKQAVAKVGAVQGAAPRTQESFKLPPLVRGTETVRPKTGGTLSDLPRNVEFSSKKSDVKLPRIDNDSDRKGSGGPTFGRPKGNNPPAVRNVPPVHQNPENKPRVIDTTPAVKPKAETFKPPQPNLNNAPKVNSAPKINPNSGVPKVDSSPRARSNVSFDSSPRVNKSSPALPNVNAAPRINDSSPALRNNPASKLSNPAPRNNVAPPKFNNPAPNLGAPRNSFSAPRAAPQSSPSNNSAPRSGGNSKAGKSRDGKSKDGRSE